MKSGRFCRGALLYSYGICPATGRFQKGSLKSEKKLPYNWYAYLDKLWFAMSDKEAVLELVKRLPATVSLREILREIEFVAAVKEGLDEID